MNEKQISELIHTISKFGQSFHSYDQLLDNEQFTISPKKVQDICRKCAKNCLELRQALLIEVKD